MRIRAHALYAVAGLLGLGSITPVLAQPTVPMRPQYSSYYNMFRPGAGSFYYGYGNNAGVYGGFGAYGGQNQMLMRQNVQLQQQLNYNNQSLANLQTYLATGVNPNLPITGRGATFNYLGHWYPQSPYGGGGGGGGFGGGGVPMVRGAGTPGGQGVLNVGTAGNGRPLSGAGQGPGMIRP